MFPYRLLHTLIRKNSCHGCHAPCQSVEHRSTCCVTFALVFLGPNIPSMMVARDFQGLFSCPFCQKRVRDPRVVASRVRLFVISGTHPHKTLRSSYRVLTSSFVWEVPSFGHPRSTTTPPWRRFPPHRRRKASKTKAQDVSRDAVGRPLSTKHPPICRSTTTLMSSSQKHSGKTIKRPMRPLHQQRPGPIRPWLSKTVFRRANLTTCTCRRDT